MKSPHHRSEQIRRLQRYILLLAVIWTAVISLSAAWEIQNSYEATVNAALTEAEASFRKDVIYRRWASLHGGVYVPVSEMTPPNPYLDVPNREVTTEDSTVLTLVNPAYMTRQVHELEEETYGLRGHITSLNPIRPANAPDDWERAALEQFETGEREVNTLETVNGQHVLRYMQAFTVEESCLACHAQQGYEIGDIRGGISVNVPMQPYWEAHQDNTSGTLLGHLTLWSIGMLGLIVGGNRFLKDTLRHEESAAALHDYAEQYRTIISTTKDGFLVIDSDTLVVDVNDVYCTLTGYARDELIGKSIADLDANEKLEDSQRHTAEIIKTRSARFETVHHDKDGRLIDVEVNTTYLPDSERFVAFIRDVTERKKSITALREAEERYRTMTDFNTEWTYWEKPDHSLHYVSPACETIIGFTPDTLQANPSMIRDLIVEEDLPIWDLHLHEPTQQTTAQRIQIRMRHQNGSIRWIEHTCRPVFDENGNFDGHRASNTDITDRKQTEVEVLKSQQRLDMTLRGTRAGIWEWNVQTGATVFNDRWAAIVGYKLSELMPTTFQTWIDLVHPDDLDESNERLQEHFAGNTLIYDCEVRMKHKDGHWVWVQSRGAVLEWTEDDKPLRMFGTHLDITARKQAESVAQENERLKAQFQYEQEQNAFIQRIISVLSHDLKTPLTVISSSKDMLITYFDRMTRDKQLEKLENIGRHVQFALTLLDETVQMARGNLDAVDFSPSIVNLAALCQVSVDEISASSGTNHNIVFANLADVETAHVDEVLINRILLNLLTNAIKYSEDGTDITLELDQEDAHIILRVTDQGFGVREEDLTRIFEAFYRVKEHRKINGSGLGLSIVQECVERHQGRIHVHSTYGEGSTFTVVLPGTVKQRAESTVVETQAG